MLIPAFERELDRKKCRENKDYVIYFFKNESWFDNIAANERSRGKRRQSAVFEECISIDGDILSSVLLPILNVSRTCMDGSRQDDELLNQSQLFITSAGWKNTFSYDKLMQLLVWSIVYPDKAFITGGSYKVPVLFGLLPKNFVSELQQDATFNESAFDREYNSYWAGSGDSAYFKGEVFDRNRKLLYAEYEYSQKQGYRGSYYILGIDIGRTMDMTVVTVLKVNPQATGFPVINVCNIYTYENLHIEDQILVFRKLHALYKPEALVVDGNGIGINYIDLMTRPQTDPDTGETYPGLGVINDPENKFKRREDEDVIDNVIYRIVANSAFNTEMYGNMQTLLNSNKVKFLIPSRDAQARLLATYRGQRMSAKARNRFLVPYNMTDVLKEELLNLRETTEGFNIRLERVNKHIHKDKVSSLGYALWYVKYMVEELKKKRKKFKASDWLFLN